MRILFIGDVVGRVGRRAVAEHLPGLLEEYAVDFTVANGENAAGGVGLTPRTAEELFGSGIDVLTSGNHIWDKRDAFDLLNEDSRIVRPANYPQGAPGRGWTLVSSDDGVTVGVVNLQGRVFMQGIDCPFRVGEEILKSLREKTRVLVVDVHAEATSEKLALGHHFSGLASAVLGTHTHVQTADEQLMDGGTAYITDVGMTGPADSIIGVRTELSVARFVTQLPQRFETASGRAIVNAVVIDVDESTGAAGGITRILRLEERGD